MTDFMKRTIAAHWLPCLSEKDAAGVAPSETSMYFAVMRGQLEKPAEEHNWLFATDRARYLRDKTDYFERNDYLVSDDDSFYPLKKSFVKSFNKWLAIQKHDVAAVNSLYDWKCAVELRQSELAEDIYDLEQAAEVSCLQKLVENTLAAKETEYKQLAQLRHNLDRAIDAVRANKKAVSNVA